VRHLRQYSSVRSGTVPVLILRSNCQDGIGSDRTQAKVQELLNKACDKIPFAKSLCHEFVPKIVAKLTEYLTQKLPASRICELLKMCKTPSASENDLTELDVEIADEELVYAPLALSSSHR